jgi:hypothetical protein
MTRPIRTSSLDSAERFGSRSNSISSRSNSVDDTYDNKIKSNAIKIVKRRKRDEPCIEISISPPDKISYYKQFLLIFNNK